MRAFQVCIEKYQFGNETCQLGIEIYGIRSKKCQLEGYKCISTETEISQLGKLKWNVFTSLLYISNAILL